MGVPKFYRWLSERYPLINQAVKDGICPEFDCFYLDMNGIIHVATHGPGVDPTQPLSEDMAMSNVFKYIDKVVRIGRPNRLLYMCLDGVAPRAKMNQQRQRRFRSAKETEEIRTRAINSGELHPDSVLFDSNCITPGTTFMANLTTHLKFFIQKKIQEDPLWKQFTVLFSGHEVPGEAEHKIMRYIRCMKTTSNYDPNTRHLLYGLDADLIFLSLATHEPHFALLREEVTFGNPRKSNDARPVMAPEDHFQLLHISVLRDCLEHEFRAVDIPFGFDLERIIDDWVFISFFVGNDFIPNLPSVDIHHGCLDRMIGIYKSLLSKFTGYITDSGSINDERLEMLLHRLSEFELEVLEMLKEDQQRMNKRRNYNNKGKNNVDRLPVFADNGSDSDPEDLQSAVISLELEEDDLMELYYHDKWGSIMDDPLELFKLCQSYIEGLHWVLLYYYQGNPSWNWYYPYFYAPLASSFRNISQYRVSFSLGTPFLPFEQLLGVLPPSSGALIPAPLSQLMVDPASPIVEFYPRDFKVDMNGKANDWEGFCLIPFVDEERLIESIRSLPASAFTKKELQRNRHGSELTFRYDPNVSYQVQSTIPGVFASLNSSHCRIDLFNEPRIPGDGVFRSHLCPGVKFPAASFPCVNILNLSMALANAGVNVFGRESKRESLVSTIIEDPAISYLDRARALLGKSCIVDWPFLRDAILVSVSTPEVQYTTKDPAVGVAIPLPKVLEFKKKMDADRVKLLSSRAVDIGSEQVQIEVRLFTGMKRKSSGSLEQEFSALTTFVPAQLLVAARMTIDNRFVDRPAQSIQQEFPLQCTVVFIGTPVHLYGSIGKVLGYSGGNGLKIELEQHPAELSFGPEICQNFETNDRWFPSFKVAGMLRLSPSALGKISSAQLANPGKVNIGLNLKFVQRQLMVPGYTRVVMSPARTSVWEYSLTAVRLIESYLEHFPEIADILEASSERIVDAHNFVPDAKEYLSRVSLYLKSLSCAHLPMVPPTSRMISPDTIVEIERVQNQVVAAKRPPVLMRYETISKKFLYKHAQRVQWSPNDLSHFHLGNRVMFLGGYHGVPFGMKGNIVGIHEGEVEVVFDECILSGSDLHGRCSASRGLRLPSKCLLNIDQPSVSQTNDVSVSHAATKPTVLKVHAQRVSEASHSVVQTKARADSKSYRPKAVQPPTPYRPPLIATTATPSLYVHDNLNLTPRTWQSVPQSQSSPVENVAIQPQAPVFSARSSRTPKFRQSPVTTSTVEQSPPFKNATAASANSVSRPATVQQPALQSMPRSQLSCPDSISIAPQAIIASNNGNHVSGRQFIPPRKDSVLLTPCYVLEQSFETAVDTPGKDKVYSNIWESLQEQADSRKAACNAAPIPNQAMRRSAPPPFPNRRVSRFPQSARRGADLLMEQSVRDAGSRSHHHASRSQLAQNLNYSHSQRLSAPIRVQGNPHAHASDHRTSVSQHQNHQLDSESAVSTYRPFRSYQCSSALPQK